MLRVAKTGSITLSRVAMGRSSIDSSESCCTLHAHMLQVAKTGFITSSRVTEPEVAWTPAGAVADHRHTCFRLPKQAITVSRVTMARSSIDSSKSCCTLQAHMLQVARTGVTSSRVTIAWNSVGLKQELLN